MSTSRRILSGILSKNSGNYKLKLYIFQCMKFSIDLLYRFSWVKSEALVDKLII